MFSVYVVISIPSESDIWVIRTVVDLRSLLTSHARHTEICENEGRHMVIDMEKGHLLKLLPHNKANRLDELNSFEDVWEVEKLHMAHVLEACHVASP